MLQAVDLDQLEQDLRSSDVVLIEIFHKLWPDVERRMKDRLGGELSTTSVFMTALDPAELEAMHDEERAEYIQTEVTKIITWRGKDKPAKVPKRAGSAVKELKEAIAPQGDNQYSQVFHSAPEGPDSEDDWTREDSPVGRAKQVIAEFIQFVESMGGT